MKLRPRLVLSVILVALPAALLATALETHREARNQEEAVRDRTLARFEGLDVEDCEADPQSFPARARRAPDGRHDRPPSRGPRRGGRIFALDAHARPYRLDAPDVPEHVARALAEGRDASFSMRRDGHVVDFVLVRPEWSSRICAGFLVERPSQSPPSLSSKLLPALLVTLAVALAVLVVAGPVVRRILRLTRAVERGDAREAATPGEDELAQLGRAFVGREATINAQVAELEAREVAMREHLAATSHDILLPITVLQGHLVELERAVSRGERVDPQAMRGALEESHYVASLVRDLNADARLRTGLVVESEVDLMALVSRARSRHAPIARHSSISIEVAFPEEPVIVRGDPTLLEQMISNLVHNAVRYGRDDGNVAIILEANLRSRRFELTIADDGVGISDELISRLGERGFRSDEARTRRPEGMGLGLHIVREVCAKHGFELVFERGEESGLVVRVSGPLQSS